MHISQLLLLTFTVMVAIVIPGCSSKSDDSTTSTTTTTTPVTSYTQKEFDDIKSGLAALVANTSWVQAEEDFLFVDQVNDIKLDLKGIQTIGNANLVANVSAPAESNPFASYDAVLQNLAGAGISPVNQDPTFADTQCAENYTDFDKMLQGEDLKYSSGDSVETVWKDIDIRQAMNCTPTSCLDEGSFDPDFMADYASVVGVCNSNTGSAVAVTAVTELKTELTALNATVYALVGSGDLTEGEFITWMDTYLQPMVTTADGTLKTTATTNDANLATDIVQETITDSCEFKTYNDKMEATCPGFTTAQELTTTILELTFKHLADQTALTMEAMYVLAGWNFDSFKDLICTASATTFYKINSDYLADAWGWSTTSWCSGSALPIVTTV